MQRLVGIWCLFVVQPGFLGRLDDRLDMSQDRLNVAGSLVRAIVLDIELLSAERHEISNPFMVQT